jgi:hypothetical protein
MSLKSVTITDHQDQVTFEKQDGCDAICIYLNDMYLTSIHKSQCNDRGWDEMANLENPTPVGDIHDDGDEVVPFWKRKLDN